MGPVEMEGHVVWTLETGEKCPEFRPYDLPFWQVPLCPGSSWFKFNRPRPSAFLLQVGLWFGSCLSSAMGLLSPIARSGWIRVPVCRCTGSQWYSLTSTGFLPVQLTYQLPICLLILWYHLHLWIQWSLWEHHHSPVFCHLELFNHWWHDNRGSCNCPDLI